MIRFGAPGLSTTAGARSRVRSRVDPAMLHECNPAVANVNMNMRRTQFPSPNEAEHAFYQAFESGDLDAMMAVWALDEDIVCVHPQGPRLQGFASVREGWRQLFASGSTCRFRVTDVREFNGALVAVRVVHEHASSGSGSISGPPVIATNVYTLTERGWCMVLHHASLAPESVRMPVPDPEGPHVLH